MHPQDIEYQYVRYDSAEDLIPSVSVNNEDIAYESNKQKIEGDHHIIS